MDMFPNDTTGVDQRHICFIYKTQISSIFDSIDFILSCFRMVKQYGDDFMTHVPCDHSSIHSFPYEREEFVYSFIVSQIQYLYHGLPALCRFLRNQEADYIDYMKDKFIKKYGQIAETVAISKSDLFSLYDCELSDLMNNIYLSLKVVLFMTDHFEKLIRTSTDTVESHFQADHAYKHISPEMFLPDICSQSVDKILTGINKIKRSITDFSVRHVELSTEKIIWRGTSAELAYLFEQLSYKGYIENPISNNGEMNKTQLARQIWEHVAPEDGKEETFIVDMRGSRLSESSPFGKAIDSIPRNRKS